MRRNLLQTIVASVMLVGGAFAANAYEAVTATYSHGSRNLTSFALTDGSNTQAFQVGQTTTSGLSIYFDKTEDEPFKTTQGAVVSFSSLTWNGEWMHGYLYVDYGKDDSFNQTLNRNGAAADGDVVSYSFIRDGDEGLGTDSEGKSVSGSNRPTSTSMPSFTIPTDLPSGTYTARFKVDWNSLDPAGVSDIGGNGGVVVDFKIQVGEAVSRTITVESADETKGTVAIDGATELSVTTIGGVTVIATAAENYQFDNWTNKETGDVVSTENPYVYAADEDITLVGNFVDKTYPVMTHYFEAINQQNRYLANVKTNLASTPTVFEATSFDDLPYTYYATASTKTTDGAVIDKTETPIVVSSDIDSFDMTFISWLTEINGYSVQIDWTQQALYIDWNSDKDFADENENYGKSGDGLGADRDATAALFKSADGYTRTVAIPAFVQRDNTTYRMRVVYHEPPYDNRAEDWSTEMFTTMNGNMRNGVAYDFALKLSSVTTDVDAVNGVEAAKVVAGANSINVIGDAQSVEVYTAGGALVSNKANVNCAAGLYIVKVDGKATKVIVK